MKCLGVFGNDRRYCLLLGDYDDRHLHVTRPQLLLVLSRAVESVNVRTSDRVEEGKG